VPDRTCSIPACAKRHYSLGWCQSHYRHNQVHGDPIVNRPVPPRGRADIMSRFWTKVRITPACWEWTAATNSEGYGVINKGGNAGGIAYTHRLSYEYHHGPIPAGYDVDHVCHNTRCVNPEHLRATTRKQNQENKSGINSNNTSGYRGVYRNAKGSWTAQVGHNGRKFYLGQYETTEEANQVVVAARLELHTHNDLDRLRLVFSGSRA
jgi:hypothetical protein